MVERPLKLAEAAERIGFGPKTVKRLVAGGYLERVVLPGLGQRNPRYLVDPASVERYLGRARGHAPRRAELAETWKARREAERAARRKGRRA